MNKRILDRGNLRDLVIGLSLISAYFFSADYFQIVVALLVLSLGTGLHVVTKATLVRNRILCTDGVYRLCRHPYYLSNFLVDIALCLLSGNVYLVLAYPFMFFWAYGPTFQSEEEKLARTFGPEFHDFVLRTPQVFPHFGSRVGWKEIMKNVSPARVTWKEWIRITRFWAVGLLVLVVHNVAVDGLEILYRQPIAMDCLIIALVSFVLLLASLIGARFSKRRGTVHGG